LTEAPTENWKTLQSEMKVTLKNELLSVLINEKEKYVKFKICDAITQIAENVYENDENWNELLNYMYSVFTKKYEESEMIQIESSLQLLTSMFGYVCDEVMKGIDVLLGTDKKESKLFREFIILILDTTMKCTDDVKEEANVSL